MLNNNNNNKYTNNKPNSIMEVKDLVEEATLMDMVEIKKQILCF